MKKRSLVHVIAALLTVLLGWSGAFVASPAIAAEAEPAYRCMDDGGVPCKTAKEYKKAFTAGEMGETSADKGDFSSRFKRKMRRAAVRQGLIPAPTSARSAARSTYKYGSWGDLWDAFTNALDCVAPGAESACEEDVEQVKKLKKPSKIVLGCGGIAVMSYFTAGAAAPAVAAIGGGSICAWGVALDAW